MTETNLESLRADVAFVGADGIDLAGGVYNASVEVGRMLGKMAAAAAVTYVVADHSRVGRTALSRFGDLTAWGGLITDSGSTRNHATALRRVGITLLLSETLSSTPCTPPRP
jgi:DeoR/GlpR family transcriptional regulator of sugar metabolism